MSWPSLSAPPGLLHGDDRPVVVGSMIAVQQLILAPLDALYVLPVAFVATALGANTGYHMYFTHRAFTTHRFFRGILALLGTLLCQDSVIQWVANHKRHHRHVDLANKDPHTPWQFGDNRFLVLTIGLWWASMGWKFDRTLTSKKFYAGQLLNEPMLSWFDKHFVTISFAGFAIRFLLDLQLEALNWEQDGLPISVLFGCSLVTFSLNLWSMGYATAWDRPSSGLKEDQPIWFSCRP